ncbi:GntR family transcriptional regulator [Nioella nitratireducens]|uniref:GntR family transcriptional regulator n=1 Tax=Nioella nitratireducens TaxID=1287720 RepID=UPI0018F66E0C|nr:GntR family transcriptional regulator [Nioella nitratireducens]
MPPPAKPAGSLPVYLQISEMLTRDIAAGRYLEGERFPPERRMAADLSISVGTLRKALAELENRGLLDRRHGSGNYVRPVATPAGVYAFFRIELKGGGGLPTAKVLDITRMQKPADLPAFGASIDAHRIRRLRFLSGIPAVLEEIWLDGAYAKALDPEAVSESLYLHYREALGLRITRAEDRVGVGTVPVWAPDAFPPRPGTPCGLVDRISHTPDGSIAEVSRNWFDADTARHVTRMR